MLINAFLSGDIKSALIMLLLFIPAVCICLTIHEASHGLCAYALGDGTAKESGRLTLDPFAHLDKLGFLCMLLIGFGWAKPVPVNISNFKIRNKRLGCVLVALAGPVSNILLAFVFTVLYILIVLKGGTGSLLYALGLFFYYAAQLSITLAVFNLVPIYPLDGSRVLESVVPYSAVMKMRRYQSIFMLILIVALWFGLLSTVTGFVYSKIYYLALMLFGIV